MNYTNFHLFVIVFSQKRLYNKAEIKFQKGVFDMTDFIIKCYDFILSLVKAIQDMVGQIRAKNDEE